MYRRMMAVTLILIGMSSPGSAESYKQKAERILRKEVLKEAHWAMRQQPVTITATVSSRSSGGKHEFYSEGDYWWPDPAYPEGPYIQRDGMSNPENFVAHRLAIIRFSKIIGTLASAYKITGKSAYVQQASMHLKAWFQDTATLMYPHLKYAQAIKGRFTGRGIGIIDAIQLMEVAQGVIVMQEAADFDQQLLADVKKWFEAYLKWVTTHRYGIDEMNAANNHGTCWVMQVAAFAKLTGDQKLMDFCRERYKTVLLPVQMAGDGSYPLELKRTKPYAYSIFNLDAMTMICQILSDTENDLWNYSTADGKTIRRGIEYMYPFVKDKSFWPLQPDVMYWKVWPVAQPFLIFGANEFDREDWFETWEDLEHSPETAEVIRNLPVRHPLIWFN